MLLCQHLHSRGYRSLRSNVCQHSILSSVDALHLKEQVRVTLWASCESFHHEIYKLLKKDDRLSEHEDTMKSMTITKKSAQELSEENNSLSITHVDLFDDVPSNRKSNDSGFTQEDSSNFVDNTLQHHFSTTKIQ